MILIFTSILFLLGKTNAQIRAEIQLFEIFGDRRRRRRDTLTVCVSSKLQTAVSRLLDVLERCFLSENEAQILAFNAGANLSLPIGSSSPEVELVVNNFYLDNGCKMANFKCVVVKTGCTTAAYISNSNTGEELAIYETSKTESIGGNVTCVAAASSGIGWRFNGVQPLFNCKTFCPSDGAGEAPADLTFPPEETTTTEKPSAGGCKVE